jgi:CubicO group peptidase (beta-lactamase class C family)
MLNHTSGFPDVEDYEWEHPQLDEGAAERYAMSLVNERLVSAPGDEFHYSNMAFDVLAAVVAKVSGQSYEAFVKENILQPLEMNESSFYQPETDVALRTAPHTRKPPEISKTYPYNRSHAPSSTLNSSAAEMSHWLIANLHQGNYKKNRILQLSSYNALMTPGFIINKDENIAIGLSWFLYQYKGHPLIGHSGSDIGYRSILTMIPGKKTGIVILANWDQTPINAINDNVLDFLLNR